jgi:UTP--glucose-1-phosphate uridylyltransferase
MLPITKSIPKEMMPLVDRPVIEYVVEEAVASGIETVIFVINDSRTALRRYFSPAPELEYRLVKSGRPGEAERLRRLSRLAEIRFVHQPEPLGVGHAIACAAAEIGDEAFAVLLADNVIDASVPCLRQLMEAYAAFPGCLVAGRKIDPARSPNFGLLLTEAVAEPEWRDRVLRVTDLVEKPAAGTVHSDFGIYGRYLLEPEIFPCLTTIAREASGEIQITDALSLYRRMGGAIYAVQFEGEHYDTGDRLGFVQATVAFAMKRPEIAPQLCAYLRGVAGTRRI